MLRAKIKPMLSILLTAALILSVSTLATVSLGRAVSDAATNGDCGAMSSSINASADTTKVTFAGKTWDVIGSNASGLSRGISGPSGTVTLLLDKASGIDAAHAFGNNPLDTGAGYSVDNDIPEYASSNARTVLEALYNSFSVSDQAQVVKRLIEGQSVLPSDATYDKNKAYGPDAPDQGVWPLSLAESIQLKASVRNYRSTASSWFTRTPYSISTNTVQGGNHVQYTTGVMYTVGEGFAAHTSEGGMLDWQDRASDPRLLRPALYVNASAVSAYNPTSGNVGTCALNPTVELGGRLWEVVGINDNGTTSGNTFGGGANTATLVLSSQNKQKLQGASGTFGSNNTYVGSNVQNAMNSFSAQLASVSDIVPRNLTDPASISNQKLWALSKTEAEALDYSARAITERYWTRTPVSSDRAYTIWEVGTTNSTALTEDALFRPAFYYNLSPEIKSAWANRNSSWGQAVTPTPSLTPVTTACFNYTAPSSLTYDKAVHAASVSVNSANCSGATPPTVYYTGVNGTSYTRTTTAPTNSGSYRVSVDGSASASYAGYYDLELGQFTVGKKQITLNAGWREDYYSPGGSPTNDNVTREFDGNLQAYGDGDYGVDNMSYVEYLSVSGVISGDNITKVNTSWQGAVQSNTNVNIGGASGQCFNVHLIRNSDPRYNFTTPDVEANKTLYFHVLNAVDNSCVAIWQNYEWSMPSEQVNGKTVYRAMLSNAGAVTKNQSQTITITVPDIVVQRGAALPSQADLVAAGQLAVSSFGSGWLTADLKHRIEGAFSWSTDPSCNTATENQSGIAGCIMRGSLDAPDYANVNFTGGKLIVRDKTPQPGDLEVASPGAKTYGDANFNLGLTPGKNGTGGGTVTYTCTDGCTVGATQVASVTAAGEVQIVGAGTFKVSATKAGDATYADKTSSEVSVSVNKYTTNVSGMQAQNRTYSGAGNTSVTLVQSGLSFTKPASKSSDTLALASCSGSVSTGAAGTRAVTLSGCLLAGASLANYQLGSINAVQISISAKEITPSFSVTSKVYDGTTNVASSQVSITLGTAQGVVSGDTLTLNTDYEFGTGAYDSKDTGTGKDVSLIVNAKPTAAMNNYTLSSSGIYPSITTADVTKKGLSVVADDVTVSRGNTRPSALTYTFSGAIGSETPAFTGALSWKASGCADMNTVGDVLDCIAQGSLALASDAVSSNYQITAFTKGKLSVVDKLPQPGDLEVASPGAKTYGDANFNLGLTSGKNGTGGGTVKYTCTHGCTVGATQVASVTVAGAVQIVGAGTFKVSATKAEDTTYAAKTSAEVSVVVSPKSISIPSGKLAVANKVYDGTLAATLSTSSIAAADITGRVASDDIGIACTTAAFTSADVGSKTVNISGCTLSGAKAGNYTLASASTTATASITAAPRTLTLNASATSGVYGTLSTVNLSATPSSGSGTVTYTCSAGCGTGDSFPATLSGSTLSIKGAGTVSVNASINAAGNYQSAISSTTSITISPKDITVSGGIAATSRVYNPGSVNVDVNTQNATFSTLVSGDSGKVALLCNQSGAMADANAGYQKDVTLSGCALSGAKASSYTLTGAITAKVDIDKANQAALTINALPALTYGDADYTLSVTGGTTGGQIAYACVSGCQSIISITDNQMSLLAAGSVQIKATMPANTNYNAVEATPLTVTVAPKSLTLTPPSATNRVYDGTSSVALAGAVLNGVLGADSAQVSLTCPSSGTVASPGVGTSKPVTIAACTISGTKAGNYSLTNATPTGVTVDIAARPLSVFADGLTVIQNSPVSIPTSAYTYSGEVGSETPTFTGALALASGCVTSATGTFANCIEQGTLSASGNYSIGSFTKGTLIVTDKIPQSITFAQSSPNVTYTGASTTFTQTASAGTGSGTITYAIDPSGTTALASIDASSGQVSSITKAGVLHIKATKAADATYAEATASYMLNVSKGIQAALAVVNPGAQTYSDTALTLSATGGSGSGTVSFAVVSGAASVAGNQLTLTGAGQVVLKAVKAEDDLYTESVSANATFSVAAKAVQVQGLSAANKEYDRNNSATVSGSPTLSGVLSADVALVGAQCPSTGTFASVNVAQQINVTLSGQCTLSGAQASSYTISSVNALAADITTRAVLITADNVQVRQNSTLPARSALTYSATGLLGGDTPQNVFEGQLEYTTLSTPGGISCTNLATSQTLSNCIVQGSLTTKVSPPGNNYRIDSFVAGNIEVIQLTPQSALSISSVSPLVLGHGCVILRTSGGSGTGAVSFANSGGNATATLNATTGELCPQTAGVYEVRAVKASDGTYAEGISQTLAIEIRPQVLTTASDAQGSVEVEATFEDTTALDLSNLNLVLTPREVNASNGVFESFDQELASDSLHRLFEIHLEDAASNVVAVPAGENVQVSIMGALKDASTAFKLWHKHEASPAVQLAAQRVGVQHLTFATDRFSLFGITYEAAAPAAPTLPPVPDAPGAGSPAAGGTTGGVNASVPPSASAGLPDTGANLSHLLLAMLLVVCAGWVVRTRHAKV